MQWINQKAQVLKQGAIRAMFDRANTIPGVISMGIGEPDMATPDLVCAAGKMALDLGQTHYTPNAGAVMLREAIANKSYLKDIGYDPAREIIITNGGMGALSLLFLVILEDGDEVLIQDPQWLNYIAQVKYCGGVPVRVPTDLVHQFEMQPEEIESRITPKTKAIMDFKKLFNIIENLKPLSAKTIREHHLLISTILGQAEKEMILPYNPAAKATPPKVTKSNPEYYQPDEMDEIIDALENAPIRWKAITYLLIDTGCRRGEVMGLKWEKLNLETGLIVIDTALLYSPSRGVYESTTKTNDVRAMILAPQTVAVLKEWKAEYDNWKALNGDRWQNSPYVFVKEDGSAMHPDSITDWLGKFSKANTLPHIHPHAFRHTAASTMILNGVDMVSAAAELGHASPSTTANIYAHQFAIARAKAASVRAGVFANRK